MIGKIAILCGILGAVGAVGAVSLASPADAQESATLLRVTPQASYQTDGSLRLRLEGSQRFLPSGLQLEQGLEFEGENLELQLRGTYPVIYKETDIQKLEVRLGLDGYLTISPDVAAAIGPVGTAEYQWSGVTTGAFRATLGYHFGEGAQGGAFSHADVYVLGFLTDGDTTYAFVSANRDSGQFTTGYLYPVVAWENGSLQLGAFVGSETGVQGAYLGPELAINQGALRLGYRQPVIGHAPGQLSVTGNWTF